MRLAAALVLALTLPFGLAACGSTKSALGPEPTTGVIVSATMDHTWIAVQQACSRLGGGTATYDEPQRRARLRVGAVDVVVALARHTSGGTIVRVGTDAEGRSDVTTTNAVVAEVQSALR
jgi:starvation-inducible outer membrane lipoprotein